jgi:hypothetical protein
MCRFLILLGKNLASSNPFLRKEETDGNLHLILIILIINAMILKINNQQLPSIFVKIFT